MLFAKLFINFAAQNYSYRGTKRQNNGAVVAI